MLTHAALKARHRAEREHYPHETSLRVHRALSWLNRAEQCGDDNDARFIFLWISFNAAYANDLRGDRQAEKSILDDFLERLVSRDTDGALAAAVRDEFSQSIRVLLSNPYVFPSFWECQKGELGKEEWENQFSKANKAASYAVMKGDTVKVLGIILVRIYVLRNQLVHGGATWNSSVNRDQVRDCTKIMGKLVPLTIKILMDHPGEPWGTLSYPVVERD